ncbi:hypothetical protein CWN11_26205, partial [Klebsiella pneumoniae]
GSGYALPGRHAVPFFCRVAANALPDLRFLRPAFNVFTALAETTGLWSEPPLRSFNAIHQQLTLFSYR